MGFNAKPVAGIHGTAFTASNVLYDKRGELACVRSADESRVRRMRSRSTSKTLARSRLVERFLPCSFGNCVEAAKPHRLTDDVAIHRLQ
jgi:hypothetical protein